MANPADADASPFGWHDTNGAAGAEFTITHGTAAHAYLDQDANNAMDFGGSPDGGAGLDFDFAADLTQHAQSYRDAVVTNLFYGNNVFHDVMHGFGFDEPAGNFQANNYGRGGLGGDYVRAEAADGSGTNNANFSTPVEPADVRRARRGCRCTSGPGTSSAPRTRWSSTALGSFDASWARFGAAPTRGRHVGRVLQREQRLRRRRLRRSRREDRDRHRRQHRLPERRQGAAGRRERGDRRSCTPSERRPPS